ncbi:MAG: CbbQ/NirQ/NorQ/GpvN family protein [Thermodesulfobacteriota bacterium]|nr:MAG: CbbQ/NirQ/NorQ/GpvN family protein [Thermodesulfobacteriota bacterium]
MGNSDAKEAQAEACASSTKEPYYRPLGREIEIFEAAYKSRMAVLLKGPTGCGKTRFVSHMAWRLGLPVHTVACHDDLTSSDLVGRYLIKGRETIWMDGPLTTAVRGGGICYLDEVVEARKDTTVILHPLSDDRRILSVEKTGEELHAPDSFMLVISYNPGYQHILKDLKPSTRQRFISLEFDYPPEDVESEIVAREGGLDADLAGRLVRAGRRMRKLVDSGLESPPGTRLLVHAAALINKGLSPGEAFEAAVVRPVTDDPELHKAMMDILNASF